VDPAVPDDSVRVRWIDVAEAGDEATVPHGPYWSPDGRTAVVQFLGENHHDVWYAEVDLEAAQARVLVHDHDDAWIGGPPIQPGRLQPGLFEWLPDGSFVFASERTGWSHLWLRAPDGGVRPLTEGAWEVRGATLSPDRSTWLLQTSREHPSEDHLYTMPAVGGAMVRLTRTPGRHEASWSPDGQRLAVVSSSSTQLPELYATEASAGAEARRVTESGTDAFYRHPLAEPEIVSFPHPDGDPVWAALYRPAAPNAERAAIVHVHGGGYRQFAHRGYSVYGWALHLGFIHYMLEQGYTVLDFDYRGSAGFGRDYRTDIADAMGISDTDGAVAGARWLVDETGVDPDRIGIYGVSYGGFLTLTSLFRYPGVFGAGIARAAVTDWAHYSDSWTSRILGVPYENPEAYRRSSPIYYAEGLEDPLLITHGLVDYNVHFQDAARLIQRLIELEKEFEVMVYPVEPHTVETEPSRYDLLRRQAAFFDEHLRGIGR
jgi:dipeptidyl aminopeptidase/acylaminoacyl peptidase